MAARAQGSAVDRAAELFTSIAAQGPATPLRQIFPLADEHGLTREEAVDALAFLEAAGMIALTTVVEVSR
ncbi:hypothetical protein J3454_14290 [Erythrobacter sp. NFXS35]|uniref:hypothetical protein n=1 Tax=Erythrobacter sp. NFXS35 TaxID=2818436 RepID=UPI0032DE66EC